MRKRLPTTRLRLVATVCITLFGGAGFSAATIYLQQDQEVRDITKDWHKKRPGSQSAAKKLPVYAIKTRIPQAAEVPESVGDSEIGITIWRYRQAEPGDEVRDLIHPKTAAAKQEWTLERVEAETQLSENQLVRLTIESLRTGRLYIINRAKFRDGTFGDPYLIFPTLRLKAGANIARVGRPIQIPGSLDDPPYFQLVRSRSPGGAIEVSEEIMLLITPQAIAELQPGADRIKLTAQFVERLKQRYGAPFERSEMQGGAGLGITKKEDLANQDPLQFLAKDDPYPQTIYRIAARPGDPLLVALELKVGGAD